MPSMPNPNYRRPDEFPDMTIPSRRDSDGCRSQPNPFPDMTIPEREEAAAPPPATGQGFGGPRRNWQVGDRVLAPWEPEFLYVGRIVKIEQDQAQIDFEDGDAGWVFLDQIRPLAVTTRLRVLSRRKMGPHFFPGEVREVDGDRVRVAFEDGQPDEWTTIAALRIPCQPIGPAAQPTSVASHMAFLKNLQPGDRVWAPWDTTTLFVGTVDEIQDREAHIHFDDGDRGWVQLEQLVPFQIQLGMPVLGRWKMGADFYPGVIAKVDGDRVFIHYDDGDKEWTTAAALVIPCQPFGPNARPTRSGGRDTQPVTTPGGLQGYRTDITRPQSNWMAWLIPIGIAIAVVAIWAVLSRK